MAKYPRKKSTPAKPAPIPKTPPPAPENEPTGLVEFDRTIGRLIRVAEMRAGRDGEEWFEIALHLERARTPLRKMMTDKEREKLR